ncbi:CBU_0592 family membrane protein [Salinimicrobium sp. GXAS 041]|uniref:CBU_0592 family membrane protein n=1 Tax=Salinimicrobium sp. GXAS 041 TaxID=3400806 RepID=UPI003C786133
MQLLFDILGWTGSGLIILAYSLTLIKNKKYFKYGKYLNLFGGLLIAVNCYYYHAIPPFVTNLLWSVIATLTIYNNRSEKRKCNKTQCLT